MNQFLSKLVVVKSEIPTDAANCVVFDLVSSGGSVIASFGIKKEDGFVPDTDLPDTDLPDADLTEYMRERLFHIAEVLDDWVRQGGQIRIPK